MPRRSTADSSSLARSGTTPRSIASTSTETDRIEKEGGKVRRVILDFELKKRVYSPLAKAVDLPPAEYADRQEEIARENILRVVDGHIVLPDLRLEYETRDGEECPLYSRFVKPARLLMMPRSIAVQEMARGVYAGSGCFCHNRRRFNGI
jgi:hypothetical protein